MSMNIDKIDRRTTILSGALDIFLTRYPTRTGLGIILGGVLDFAVQIFAPTLRTFKFVDFTANPWYGWLGVGLLTMHLPTIFSSFRQKSIGNDAIDQALALIERADFSPAEKRRQYRKLVEQVLKTAALNQEIQREMKKIENSLNQGKNP